MTCGVRGVNREALDDNNKGSATLSIPGIWSEPRNQQQNWSSVWGGRGEDAALKRGYDLRWVNRLHGRACR